MENRIDIVDEAIENISKNVDRRQSRKYKKFSKNKYGEYINKDGSLRRSKRKPYSNIRLHAEMAAGHRQGSLGEDEESIML